MIRLSLFPFCCILVSDPVLAFPKPGIQDRPSLIARVQETQDFPGRQSKDTFSSPPRQGVPANCRQYSPQDGPEECVAYRRKLAGQIKEKQAAALAKAKAARKRPPAPKPGEMKTAKRAVGELERNAVAAKPLTPSSPAVHVKPVPGKTAEERLRHMAGQLVLTGFAGRQPADAGAELVSHQLRDGKISGILVRDSNIANARQLRHLLPALGGAGGDSPALIAIEQPGGPDAVLSENKGFAFYGSANAISGANSPYEAQIIYRAMARDLAALGVTLNIGPSEDVCRESGVNLSAVCFGTSPSRVAAFVRAFNFAHHDYGVLTALRHVPFQAGLSTSWASERPGPALLHHLVKGETSDAAVIRIKAMELLPLAAFASGMPLRKTKARGYRNFEHARVLIFEMEMGPSGAPIRYSEAILRAFAAGADMILVREPSALPGDIAALSLEAVRTGVASGRLPLARIEEAYQRVQRLKARLRTFPARTRIAELGHDPVPSSPGGVQ